VPVLATVTITGPGHGASLSPGRGTGTVAGTRMIVTVPVTAMAVNWY
jgi:hypothetical protein